jgi:hypothetical protein
MDHDDDTSILVEVSSAEAQQKLKDRFPFLCAYGLRRYPRTEPNADIGISTRDFHKITGAY